MHTHVHIELDAISGGWGQIAHDPVTKALTVTVHPVDTDVIDIDGSILIMV